MFENTQQNRKCFPFLGDKTPDETELAKANSETAISDTTSEIKNPEITAPATRSNPPQPTVGLSTQSRFRNSKNQFENHLTKVRLQRSTSISQIPPLPRSTITSCVCKGIILTSPMKSIAELKQKERGKRFITVGLETKQYLSVSKLQ